MPTAAQYGMATPAGTDLIRLGDNAITQNANATATVLTRLEAGKFVPQSIPSGTDLLTLDTGWWYNRLTSVAGTMLNRPQGVTDGPFMVHMVRTPFGHSTITYYGYSGTAGGLFENHTGNAAHTAWVGWRRLDGTTGGGITQGSGLAGFANILRTQMFRDAMGPVTTSGKGAIAFRFDHGLSKFNSIMRPLLEARGIKYSLALSVRNFNAGENAGVTASMVNSWAGAEVWNHGANQHQDESSVAGLTDQIVTGLAELQAALPNKQIWGYAVPGTGGSGQGGFFGGATAEQFYETAAGDLILTNHAVSSGSMSGTSRRPLDGRVRQGMAHFTIEAQTVARIKSEIDNAISNKTGNQLMMHPNLLNTEGYLTTAQLVEVLDYVVAKRDAGDLVVLSPYEMLVAQLSTSGGSGVPGPPGAGVPAGGEALQVIRKNAFNTTTEWATLTKSLVGLSNVDNTSDMNKPVSTMQKLALDEKIDAANLPDELDGVNKNLIEDPASLTATALSTAIDGSIVGSEYLPATFAGASRIQPNTNLAVVLGNSISDQINAKTNGWGWFPQLCVRTKQRIKFGGVFATGGYSISQIRDVHLPQVLALTGWQRPGAAFLLMGTNDLQPAGSNTFDFAASKAAYLDVVEALTAAGIVPIICLDPPITGGYGNEHKWNRWLVLMCQERGLLPPVDFYAALVDRTTGGIKAEWAQDSKHPNQAGYKRMATYAIAQGIAEYFPASPSLTAVGVTDTLNKVPASTAFFLQDNPGSPGRSIGWVNSGGTSTFTREIPAPGEEMTGYWQHISRTYPLEVAGSSTLTTSPTIGGVYAADGDWIEFSCRIKTSGVEATGAIITVSAKLGNINEARGLFQWTSDVEDGVLYGTRQIAPGTINNSTITVAVTDPVSAGTVDVAVGEMTLRNLTTGELLSA